MDILTNGEINLNRWIEKLNRRTSNLNKLTAILNIQRLKRLSRPSNAYETSLTIIELFFSTHNAQSIFGYRLIICSGYSLFDRVRSASLPPRVGLRGHHYGH